MMADEKGKTAMGIVLPISIFRIRIEKESSSFMMLRYRKFARKIMVCLDNTYDDEKHTDSQSLIRLLDSLVGYTVSYIKKIKEILFTLHPRTQSPPRARGTS